MLPKSFSVDSENQKIRHMFGDAAETQIMFLWKFVSYRGTLYKTRKYTIRNRI